MLVRDDYEMLKKLFCSILVFVAVLCGSYALTDKQAEAADIWAYTASDGTVYYVDDDRVTAKGDTLTCFVKGVESNGMWSTFYVEFMHNGRVWVRRGGSSWHRIADDPIYRSIFYVCCDVKGWGRNQPLR